jgi:hypothetical protein
MARRKTEKDKTYVCVICGKGKKAPKKAVCCGKKMVAKEKGSWNL